MAITHDSVEDRIISTIAKCTNFSPDQLDSSHWQDSLLSNTFNLFSVDLIYILFEIEQEFNIRISSDALTQYQFSSIEGICSAVQKALMGT